MLEERQKFKKTNPSYANMLKLIVNSFYGKTIAKDPESAYIITNDEKRFHKQYNFESLLMGEPIIINKKQIMARIDCRKLDDLKVYETISN